MKFQFVFAAYVLSLLFDLWKFSGWQATDS